MKLRATGTDCGTTMMKTIQVSTVGDTGRCNESSGSTGSHGVSVGGAESTYTSGTCQTMQLPVVWRVTGLEAPELADSDKATGHLEAAANFPLTR